MTKGYQNLVKSTEDGRKKLPGRWKKGESGNPAGRQKGVPNKATREVKTFCRGVLENGDYRERLFARAVAGDLHASVECLLYYYAYGKPKETFEVQTPDVAAVLNALPPERQAALAQRAAEALAVRAKNGAHAKRG